MNVYDFDKTIYDGDSTADFYFYSLKKHPKILTLVPSLALSYAKFYILKKGTKTECKEVMYRFLRFCDTETDVMAFWETHITKIKPLYLQRKKDDDVIISASPRFLLEPVAKNIGFKLIASEINPENGVYSGINCHGKEKVRRFYEELGNGAEINEFYSDSKSDTPLAEIAKKAYIVRKNKIFNW